MFIGHFALAFAAKRVAPPVSLGTLFLACQLADLVWPNLVLLGIERVSIAATPSLGSSSGIPAAIPWAAQAMWLIVAGAYWIDRHRPVKVGA